MALTVVTWRAVNRGVKVPVGDAQPRVQGEALAPRGPKISR